MNEICVGCNGASVLYALIRRASDQYIYNVRTAVFEAIGTWNDARVGECAIAMTVSGDVHFADFPVVVAGTYKVCVRLRVGVSPATSDTTLYQGEIIWDGTAEYCEKALCEPQDKKITIQIENKPVINIDNKPTQTQTQHLTTDMQPEHKKKGFWGRMLTIIGAIALVLSIILYVFDIGEKKAFQKIIKWISEKQTQKQVDNQSVSGQIPVKTSNDPNQKKP